ncbi:porin [Aminobacter sp. LjRoot7]|uniref:porin n=1 Tax=Aminobacter sp. LjRoot7 TaxID=3342335 RepID=UPI003ECCBF7B
MNIKSLLLGSAAALLAVSGARAADAVVVAEPEPMEYVRICDVYGAGFYYIPGTETCLKIGGLVRYQINWNSSEDFADLDDSGWRKTALARLKFDARSETEYGTFKRYIEIEGRIDSGSSSAFTLRHAYFELGGLLVGFTDTLYDGDLSGEFDSGGGARIHQIRYTFDAGNGIAVSAGLEEADSNEDYVPNVTGKVSIAQGWGGVDLFAAYDATAEEFALKAIANFKATEALTLSVLATYESGESFYSVNTPLSESYDGFTWSLGGYAKYQVNEKLAIGAGAQYFADEANGFDHDAWAAGAVVDYKVVENLDAKLAVNYEDGDHGSAWGGFLRLDASF